MNDKIKERVIKISNYILLTHKNVREIALEFDVNKSTVHLDLTERLVKIDIEKYKKVRKILEENKIEGRKKGGRKIGGKNRKKGNIVMLNGDKNDKSKNNKEKLA